MLSDILLKKGELSNSFKESFTRYYSSTVDNKEYAEHKLSKWGNSQNILIYVAEKDNEIVGIITAKIYRSLRVAGYERRGYMSNLFVKRKNRRQGIGKKLFTAAIEWLRSKDAKAITLEIHKENKKTIDMYHKLGFREFATKMFKRI